MQKIIKIPALKPNGKGEYKISTAQSIATKIMLQDFQGITLSRITNHGFIGIDGDYYKFKYTIN